MPLSLGGLALLFLTPWVALAVVILLAVVVVSYRQTCYAYPNGGGAYAVSRENLESQRGPGSSQCLARRLCAHGCGISDCRRGRDHLSIPQPPAVLG